MPHFKYDITSYDKDSGVRIEIIRHAFHSDYDAHAYCQVRRTGDVNVFYTKIKEVDNEPKTRV